MVAVLHEPISLSGREHYATTSVGIALGQAGSSADQLLRDADAAMYRAKDLGRARIELFSHELQQQVAAALRPRDRAAPGDRARGARAALPADRATWPTAASWAPRRSCGGTMRGHGVVLPAEFIPIAEETGMIVADRHLGARSTRSPSCARWHRLRTVDADWPLLAVNLSALQLRLARPARRWCARRSGRPASIRRCSRSRSPRAR